MKKLTKSATDRQVSGVLGGIAEYFGIDSTIIRVLFLVFTFAGVGSPIFLYIILALLLPEPNRNDYRSGENSSYGDPIRRGGRSNQARPRKEAKPVKNDEDDNDNWSDF